MIYNVRYWDKTGSGLPFNEDIELDRIYSDEEQDLLKLALKQEIVNKLRNTAQESDIEVESWVVIDGRS